MASQKVANSWSTIYKFNAKPLDAEICTELCRSADLYYYGARYYGLSRCGAVGNPRISLWYGVDPMTSKYPSWNAYSYTFNNPINLNDPTGGGPEWIPKLNNNKIVLLAEANDNLSTLKQYLKGSRYQNQAESMWNSRKHNIGTHVSLPENNYSRALAEGSNLPSREQVAENLDATPSNYNCYHFAINGAWEKDINSKNSFGEKLMDMHDADKVLKTYFEEVTSDKAIFGETLIGVNYPKDSDIPQHLMVYVGKDSQGNIMAMQKDGDKAKPNIIKIKDAGTGDHSDFKFYNEKAKSE